MQTLKEIVRNVSVLQAEEIQRLINDGVDPVKAMELTKFGTPLTLALVSYSCCDDSETLRELPHGQSHTIQPVELYYKDDGDIEFKASPYKYIGTHPYFGRITGHLADPYGHSDIAQQMIVSIANLTQEEFKKMQAYGIEVDQSMIADCLVPNTPYTYNFIERIINVEDRTKDAVFPLPANNKYYIQPITLIVYFNSTVRAKRVGDEIPSTDPTIVKLYEEWWKDLEKQFADSPTPSVSVRGAIDKLARMDMEMAFDTRRRNESIGLGAGGYDRKRIVVLGAGGPSIGAHLLDKLRPGDAISVEYEGIGGFDINEMMADSSQYVPGDGVVRDSRESKRSKNEIVMTEKGNMYPRPKQRLGRR